MPNGKGYTPSELQTLRDHGVLTPSEIEILRQGYILSPSQSDYVRRTLTGVSDRPTGPTPTMRGAKAGTRRSRSQGYKYFPDNP